MPVIESYLEIDPLPPSLLVRPTIQWELGQPKQAQRELTKLLDGLRINAILAQSMGNGVSHMHVAHQ